MRSSHNSTLFISTTPILILVIATFTVLPAVSSSETMSQPNITTRQHTSVLSNKERATSKSENTSTRKANRLGTAIQAEKTDKSIRLKSTDAGPIPLYPSYSGCINCGVMELPHQFDYGYNMPAIMGGIIGGTIARKIGTHFEPNHRLNIPHRNIDNPLHNNQQPVIIDKQLIPYP